MNYRLTLQYDGTDFHGWQMQGRLRTVQSELTRALSLIDGRAGGDEVTVHGAGRTDAGVHAEAQIASVHLRRAWSPGKLRAAVNGNVNRDLRVAEAEIAPDEFHARFSASGKTYVYRVYRAAVMSPFWARWAHHEGRPLDVDAARAAARLFVGRHDWTAFSSAQSEVRSRVRVVTRLDIAEHAAADGVAGGRLIEMTVEAEGFLRYMVRSIAGTLLAVGRGEMTTEQITRALKTGDRSAVGATAPARGLTLRKVHYAEQR